MPVIAKYVTATLVPLVLLMLGATVWGGFAVAALLWLTLVATLLDHCLDPPAQAAATPGALYLSVLLALGHMALIPLVLAALTASGLSPGQKIALFFATASFIGQVSHPNAHELIHARTRWQAALGALVYTSIGFGHHVSAHRLVHHRHVATLRDPNTARIGESFWRYLPRAWAGSFRAGLRAERDRRSRRGKGPWRNPYWLWVGGAALAALLAARLTGATGLAVLLGLWALGGSQILMSDYIQHYGLRRLPLPSNRLEPVGPHHSWDAPRGFSSYLMLNAPSHADHHLHPGRAYTQLHPQADAPVLPLSLPVMAVLATIPPVWRRLMDRRAARVMAAAEARIATDRAAA